MLRIRLEMTRLHPLLPRAAHLGAARLPEEAISRAPPLIVVEEMLPARAELAYSPGAAPEAQAGAGGSKGTRTAQRVFTHLERYPSL